MRLTRQLRDDYLQREIRTHGRKNGYVTKGQQVRFEQFMPLIELKEEEVLSSSSFPNPGPIIVEIGIGNGAFLVDMAEKHPEWNLLGIDIYLPGVAKALSLVEQSGVMPRIRLAQAPAQLVLGQHVENGTIDGFVVNHPDPWPKKRHEKRRLLQMDFVNQMVSRLKPGGFIRIATDHPAMVEWMEKVFLAVSGLRNTSTCGFWLDRDENRIVTKFEARGLREGRESKFAEFVRLEGNYENES